VLHRARMWVEAEEHGRRPPVGSCPHGSPLPICLFLGVNCLEDPKTFCIADPEVFCVQIVLDAQDLFGFL
jgi:hypothetical protein